MSYKKYQFFIKGLVTIYLHIVESVDIRYQGNRKRIAKRLIFVISPLMVFLFSSCTTPPPPHIHIPLSLIEKPYVELKKLPLRVGVNKFSEENEYSLDLKNIIPSISPFYGISNSFTDNFVHYLHESGIFELVLKEPFEIEDVDIVLNPRILELQSEEPDYDAAMAGAVLRGLLIVGAAIPQHQKVIGTVEIEVLVRNSDGEFMKTYIEKASTTIDIQTLGAGSTASFKNFIKRPDIIQSMTLVFRTFVNNLVADKEIILESVKSNQDTSDGSR